MPSRLENPVTGGAPNLLGSLTAAARAFPEDADWQAFGVSHTPENCGAEWVWQACTEADKPLNEPVPAVRFQPFLVEYNAPSCAGMGGDFDRLELRARRGLALRTSKGIAHAISSSEPTAGAEDNLSPSFPTLATDITPGGGPGGIACTVAGILEDAEACGLTGEIYLHAPGWTLPHWLEANLITPVGNVFKMGPHTVVLDQGYSNEAPTGAGPDPDVAASPAAVPGQAYIYATGPVEYATGPVQVLNDTTRGLDTRLNQGNMMAAQLAIYRFDPCCVFAGLAQVC